MSSNSTPNACIYIHTHKIHSFIYVAMLGLHCCVWAFSSCREQGLFSSCVAWASHCGGFSCCRAWALGAVASVAVTHWLSCPTALGSYPTRDQICVPWIGRWTLTTETSRKSSVLFLTYHRSKNRSFFQN